MELIETLTDKQFSRLVFLERYLKLQESKKEHLKKEFLLIQEAAVEKNLRIKALKSALATRDLLIEKLLESEKIEEEYLLKRLAREVSKRLNINIHREDTLEQIVNRIRTVKLAQEAKYMKLVWANALKEKEASIWKEKIKELMPELLPEIYTRVDEMREGFTPAPSIEAASFCKQRAKDRAESEQGAQL